MSKRPKRKTVVKSKSPDPAPRRWLDTEMEILLNCLMKYGHKNINKIQQHLPGRSTENIKTFIRTIHDTAGKQQEKNVLDFWINESDKLGGTTPWRDCIQIAQILKYLSVDGLIENHPVPDRCQGIDFRLAYQLVYQAVMGYPIQPVNKATADFVFETLAELNSEIKKETDVINKVESFLLSKTNSQDKNTTDAPVPAENTEPSVKKPLKVYQRKKSSTSNVEVKPSLRIFVEEIPGDDGKGSGSKDYSVAIEGGESSACTTVNVPVPYQKEVDKSESELIKSSSYNPFEIPGKCLEEPLYVNLRQTL